MNKLFLCWSSRFWCLTVSDAHFAWLQRAASLELNKSSADWTSSTLIGALNLCGAEGYLDDATAEQVMEQVRQDVLVLEVQQGEAVRRGLSQAVACLGKTLLPGMSNEDIIREATKYIANYVSAHANFPRPFEVVRKNKTKPRAISPDNEQVAVYKLAYAVRLASEAHPEWPISCAGLVRLYPRAPRPVTCAGMYVKFEGHPAQAVVWQLE